MMNLKLVLLVSFGLLNSQVLGKPGLTPPDGIDEFASHQAQAMETPCEDLDDTCIGCLSNEGCKFAFFSNSETKCVDENVNDDEIRKMKPNSTLEDVALNEDRCSQSGDGDDKPATQVPPKFSTTLTPENGTTSTVTPSTSASPTPAPSTTTVSTSTSTTTTTESTTPSTTSTEKPTTATTIPSTTTEKPSSPVTTAAPVISTTPPVDPSGKSGSKFDGWSFFGGILLTIGLSAIGFVSFKYYKVRSGGSHAGTNYNRF